MIVERPSWKVEDVPKILSVLEPVSSSNGFLVSAYGSTMRRGVGRDLDLIFVQKRVGAMPGYLLGEVTRALHGHPFGPAQPSMFAELCAMIELPDGRLIDMQVRLSRCGPRDAMEMFEAPPRGTEDPSAEDSMARALGWKGPR